MTKLNRVLLEARQILQQEILELKQALNEKEIKLAEINRLLGTGSPLEPKVTISEAVITILKEAESPLSAQEISSRIREMRIPQKAANPHNSILALLHHLKKRPDTKVKQGPDKKWYWDKG